MYAVFSHNDRAYTQMKSGIRSTQSGYFSKQTGLWFMAPNCFVLKKAIFEKKLCSSCYSLLTPACNISGSVWQAGVPNLLLSLFILLMLLVDFTVCRATRFVFVCCWLAHPSSNGYVFAVMEKEIKIPFNAFFFFLWLLFLLNTTCT